MSLVMNVCTEDLSHPGNAYMTHSRRYIYTACENLEFQWDLHEVEEFDSMWKQGLSINEIARRFHRRINEVKILAMDRLERNAIRERGDALAPNKTYKLSDAQREAIKKLIKCGMAVIDIADAVGVNRSVIASLKRRMKVRGEI